MQIYTKSVDITVVLWFHFYNEYEKTLTNFQRRIQRGNKT